MSKVQSRSIGWRDGWITSTVLSLLLLAATFVIVEFADRGLDISDEGIYLLAAQNPAEVLASVTAAHHDTALLFRACAADIPCFRVSGMVVLLSATAFFSLGVGAALQRHLGGSSIYTRWPFLFPFSALGSLLYYVWLPPSPSYNLVNTVSLLVSAGAAFTGLVTVPAAATAVQRIAGFLCWTVAGMAACFMLLAKLPSGLLLFLLWILVLAFWPGFSRAGRWQGAIALLCGLVAGLTVHHSLLQSLAAWYGMVARGLVLTRAMQGGHGIEIVPRYVYQLMLLSMGATRLAVPALFAWLLVWVMSARTIGATACVSQRRLRMSWLASCLGLALTAGLHGLYMGGQGTKMVLLEFYLAVGMLLAGVAVLHSLWSANVPVPLRTLLAGLAFLGFPPLAAFDPARPASLNTLLAFGPWWLGVLLSFVAYRQWMQPSASHPSVRKPKWRMQEPDQLACILLVLPPISVIGTNNPLATNMLLAMAPWFACGALFLARTSHDTIKAIPPFLPVVVGAFASLQVATNQLVEPYRLEAGILEHRFPTDVGTPASSLKLPNQTHQFITQLRELARDHGLRAGDDIIGLVRLPGLVYALGAKAPAVPWFVSWYPGSRRYNELALQMIPAERRERAFVLLSSFAEKALPDLAAFGIDLHKHYELCGELVWPVSQEKVQLWRPLPAPQSLNAPSD